MTISELENKMKELEVSEDSYSIMIDGVGLPYCNLCIIKKETWQVYVCERGNKFALKEFQTESEACSYFYQKILRSIWLDKEFEESKQAYQQLGQEENND